MIPVEILELKERLPSEITSLVLESERAGYRFLRRLVDDWEARTNRFDAEGEALCAAWVRGRLVGCCGLNVDPYAGSKTVGRVRHLYVAEACRGAGVGRRLVEHVLGFARTEFREVRLRTDSAASAAFYEHLVSCNRNTLDNVRQVWSHRACKQGARKHS